MAYLYWFGMIMVGVSDCSTKVPRDFTTHEPFVNKKTQTHNTVTDVVIMCSEY